MIQNKEVLEQIREEAEELQADLLLFNDSLTPSQLHSG